MAYAKPDDMTQQGDQFVRDNRSARMDRALPSILPDMNGPKDTPAGPDNASANRLVDLLKAVQSQDRAAFDLLYDATVQRVFSLALRITRQHELAEEVVGDVYLQVWRRAAGYSPERGKVIAWLCVLCRSRALDALRRGNSAIRQAAASIDSVPEPADLHEPPDLLESMEKGTAIHAALGKLTEQQRQLMALAYFRGHSHRELAAITGLPLGTVKTNLHRTMARLKELMSNGADMSGEFDG